MSVAFSTCDLLGMQLAQIDGARLLDHMFEGLATGRGGWIVTANLDFIRRFATDPEIRSLYAAADIRVADGMPLVWAARLQGDTLPGRLAGSDLAWEIPARAALEGRSIYLLGGTATANARAAEVLATRWPGLVIRGHSSPMVSSPPTSDELSAIRRALEPAPPDILLVGMGSPKQEHLIHALRSFYPAMWSVGVGASFSFIAGEVQRAPAWMQRSGLEWCWRLGQEPRRLARRYLVEDLPFFCRLMAGAAARRAFRQRR